MAENQDTIKQQDLDTEQDQAIEADEEEQFDPQTATREQWERQLQKKDEELSQLNEKVLRIAAEMENTRRRLERERQEGISFANESLIRDFLPVLDNLERALQHGDNDIDVGGLLEGVDMIRKNFLSVLERFGCKAFESIGEPFDPNLHEAMLQQESAEHPENTVLQEYQKGYMLRDRLLRPALVVVSKPPADGSASADDEES